MAIQKRKQFVKVSENSVDEVHLVTSADIVEVNISGLDSENVSDALGELYQLAKNSGVTSVNGETGAVTIDKTDVGLGNVDNVKQYSASNPPPYPVTSVAGKTGAVTLAKSDVGLGNVTNEAQIPLSQKGVASGVATLGTDGKVPTSQLPSYVDDVLEYENRSKFPSTGETGKIYVAKDTNITFRWSGTAYVEISASLALGETSSTAYAGDKGKANATAIADITNGTTKVGSSSTADKVANKLTFKTISVSGSSEEDTVYDGSSAVTIGDSSHLIYGAKRAEQDSVGNHIANTYATKSALNNVINGTTPVAKATAADSAGKLTSAKSFALTGDVTGTVSTDLSSGMSIATTLKNSGVEANTYSAVTVNAKGIVTAGAQIIEWGTSGQTTPSESLAVGGLFMQLL